MLLFEGVLATLAYASVIVATLRAGSRALYLTEHDSIGVMQGPLILGPQEVENRSMVSSVWDLAYPFQEGVRLALFPESFQYVEGDITLEPYTMAQHAHSDVAGNDPEERPSQKANSMEKPDQTSKNARIHLYYDRFVKQPSSFLASKIQFKLFPRVETMRQWILSQRQLAATREWILSHELTLFNRFTMLTRFRRAKLEIIDEDSTCEDGEDDTWDYSSERKADLEFNSTAGENITARITVHAPDTFADLRSWFGITELSFQTSILESGPYISFQSNSKGAARAGGCFFFTRDGAYMIKTIKKDEAKTLVEMLPKYHKYMRNNGRKSLLTRFCGMYTVKLTMPSDVLIPGMTTEKEHVFVIMNSVFPAEGSQFISERYDLKGSTVGRECSEQERADKGRNAVLKDLDLAREVELLKSLDRPSQLTSGYGFQVGPSFKASLLSQLRRDVTFLAECQVMDYSLLVGVVNMDTGNVDVSSLEVYQQSGAQESMFRQLTRRQNRFNKLKAAALHLLAPIHIMSAPVVYFGRRAAAFADTTLSSILTRPLPYYGAGICGVDGGALAMVEGTRSGKRAIYYLGLIDFLQPWTARKVLERQMKSMMGYDTHAISCVAPEEYASRFLEFIDAHIS